MKNRLHHSPWWLVSVKPPPPAGLTQSPPAPPWQRCGGECSHWLLRHQDEPCAATAAALSPFSPGGMQCEAESALPVQDTVSFEKVVYSWSKSKCWSKESLLCECDNSSLTRARASTIAPFLRRHLTTSTWPARAAMCKAVSPRWTHTTVSTHTENLPSHFHLTENKCINEWIVATFPVTLASFPLLTILLTSAEAPFCSRSRTMFRWPMKAATWMGVRPDWTQEKVA